MAETDGLHILSEGYELQEFKVIRMLGEGGFGVTYLAYDRYLDKDVAIKEYLPSDFSVRQAGSTVVARSSSSQSNFDWGLSRFFEEAKTLAKFNHVNIVKVNRFFHGNGTAYIVMDYVEGQNLDDYLDEGLPHDEDAYRDIFIPILEGLKLVHNSNYLHRDIKPENIMLQADGTPVLIDFGAARLAIGTKSKPISAIVTPGYAPIEQYNSKSSQMPATDIYALAAVSYHAITGEIPPEATERVANEVDNYEPLADRDDLDGWSDAFLSAIDAGMALRAINRPQSLEEWQNMMDGSDQQDMRALERHQMLIQQHEQELELEKQRVTELEKERQEELERERQEERERQRQEQLERERQEELERERQEELEGQRQEELERERQEELEKQRQEDLERERQEELERERQEELERERQEELEKQRQEELERGRQEELEREKELELEKERQTELAREHKAELEKERQQELERKQALKQAEKEAKKAEKEAKAKKKAEAKKAKQKAKPKTRKVPDADSKLENPDAISANDKQKKIVISVIAATVIGLLAFGGFQWNLSRKAADEEALLAAEAAAALEKMTALVGGTVIVEPASFRMGDLSDTGADDEYPVHTVFIDYRLEVSINEVTFAQWDACIAGGGCDGYSPADEGWGRDNRPVINVSYDDIQGYLTWLNDQTKLTGDQGGWRLLSETEWEYVARAGSTTNYSWGDSIGSANANCDGCGSEWDNTMTAPVGSFQSNNLGVFDLHGNVWEWVDDCWNDNYIDAPADGSVWQTGRCNSRVLRGGAWYFNPIYLRSAYRFENSRQTRSNYIGFRIARTVD